MDTWIVYGDFDDFRAIEYDMREVNKSAERAVQRSNKIYFIFRLRLFILVGWCALDKECKVALALGEDEIKMMRMRMRMRMSYMINERMI